MKNVIRSTAVWCMGIAGWCLAGMALAQSTVTVYSNHGRPFIDMTVANEPEPMTWNQAMGVCARKGMKLPRVEDGIQLKGFHDFPPEANPIAEEHRLPPGFYWTRNPVNDFGDQYAMAVNFGGKHMEMKLRSSQQLVRCVSR